MDKVMVEISRIRTHCFVSGPTDAASASDPRAHPGRRRPRQWTGCWLRSRPPAVTRSSAAAAWSGRLGFTKEWEHRFEPGLPAFVSVARGPMRLFLSEHQGDARPDALIYLRMADVDAIAAEFGVAVEEAPWARELELRDPDGNRLRIGTPIS